MTRFLVRRLALSLAVLFGVSLVVFALIHLAEGDPVRTALGTRFDPELYEQLRARAGLDRPLATQYLQWAGNAVTGDLGVSFRTGRAVTPTLLERAVPTVLLAVAGIGIGIAVALPLGIAAARRAGGWADRLITAVSQVGVSVPDFFLALLLLLVFAGTFQLLPSGGYRDPFDEPVAFLRHLVLPATTVGLVAASVLTRFVRSAVLEELGQDSVRTARSKGLTEKVVLRRHVLRAALVPLVTVSGLQLATLLGGVIIVERVFDWRGLGLTALEAIRARDYPVLQGAVLFVAVGVLVVNLVVDLLYAVLDPRISRS